MKILKTLIKKKVNRSAEITFPLNRKFYNCLSLDSIKTSSSSYLFEVTTKYAN